MKVLGVDIGIKNFAICLIDTTQWKRHMSKPTEPSGILIWQVLSALETNKCCCGTKKNGGTCTAQASYQSNNDQYYCGRHKHSQDIQYIRGKANQMNSVCVNESLFRQLDAIPELQTIDMVRIESQPRINQKMKMLAAGVANYFTIRHLIDRNQKCSIVASSARRKLDNYTGPEIKTTGSAYVQRKKTAIEQVKWYLRNDKIQLEKLKTKKADDLADAFLHATMSFQK